MTLALSGRALLPGAIALSGAMHAALLIGWPVHHAHREARETVGLDLIDSPHPTPSSPKGRPSRAAPPKEWRLPAKQSPVERVPAVPEPAVTEHEHGAEEAAGGSGAGHERALRPPVLLNHGELHRLLQRLYPETERELGREGLVVLELSIDAQGNVAEVKVSRSAGSAFDRAARRIASQLRYAPAEEGGRPVAVSLRQAVVFKLER